MLDRGPNTANATIIRLHSLFEWTTTCRLQIPYARTLSWTQQTAITQDKRRLKRPVLFKQYFIMHTLYTLDQKRIRSLMNASVLLTSILILPRSLTISRLFV